MGTIVIHNNGPLVIEAGLRGVAAPQERLPILQKVPSHFLGQRFLLPRKEPVVPPKRKAAIPILTEESLVIGNDRMPAAGALTYSHSLAGFSSTVLLLGE